MAAVSTTSSEPAAVLVVADSSAQMAALVTALGETREEVLPSGTIVERGVVAARDGALIVAAVEIDPSNHAAASTAQEVTMRLQPAFLLLVGLADGLYDVRPGDVVAADRIYGFASGTAGATRLSPRPDVGRSSYRLVQRARAEARRSDWLLRVDPRPVGDDAPQVFVKPVAAGDVVVESSRAAIFKFLRDNYNDAIAVETAGRGFLETAYQNQLDVLVIRAIRKALHGDLPATAVPVAQAAKHAAAFALSVVARLTVDDSASAGGGERREEPKYETTEHRQIAELRRQCESERRALMISRPHLDGAKRIAIDKAVAEIDTRILSLREKQRSGPQLTAGETLGDRYEVIKRIGGGDFGTVWQAYDDVDQRHVALKVLHGHLVNEQTARERFFRGARRMAELRHPHIVGVTDTGGVDRGFHYFAMELMEGNLHGAVVGGLPLPDRIRMIAEVAQALQYTHERGIIHRDVKPDNILHDAALSARLADFDLVRAAGTIARTRGALGTYDFTAPEAHSDAAQATHNRISTVSE
jgi:nucleoside phosphorylase